MAEKEYIEREAALESIREKLLITEALPPGIPKDASTFTLASMQHSLESIPAADVLPRDEAIKMGAELAAMHGSDATSQQLEEAYLKGVEYGMTRRDVWPVVRGKWIEHYEPYSTGEEWIEAQYGYECSICGRWEYEKQPFCNCGAMMEES